MTTKSSTKTKKENAKYLGACFIALGAIIGFLIIELYCFSALNKPQSYLDRQKTLAFDDLVDSYIYEMFSDPDKQQAAAVTGSGITEDDDLYVDFVITKYEDRFIPISRKNARLHFQCHDENGEKSNGCSFAYWYGEEVETSEEEREEVRKLVDEGSD